MEQNEFVSLVEGLEAYAREHPAAYKFRVGMLAALGYVMLLGTVLVVLLLIGVCLFFGAVNFVVIKFLIIPIGFAAVILRSMWVKFPKPEGHRLAQADAPRLFEVIQRIRIATKGPKVHKVLLTGDFNASIVQRPRLGILGWQENYLMVGLPMLNALSPDEMRAIIAHEFGHLSGQHGTFSAWIYRVQQTWVQVLHNMQQNQRYGTELFERFFNWYSPYFSAYSFVLNRATELEADRYSVILAGRQNAARALINSELKQRALDAEHWPEFFYGADTRPDPPEKIFSVML
ncbi:MAG TPA: M48 family metallopeptidase, partial [Pyrinomonadaceae bacterium]|nr:M48 family metallopeptidase [Pyrinomonadaceae bacterium]